MIAPRTFQASKVDHQHEGFRMTAQGARVQEASGQPAGLFPVKNCHFNSGGRNHLAYNSGCAVDRALRTRLASHKQITPHGQPVTNLEVLL